MRRSAYKGASLILINEDRIPYSFLNFIFINKAEFELGKTEAEVLTHELSHVQQKHSLDILFIELLTILAWFNPFIYLYKRAMQLNHEFLADDAVIAAKHDAIVYQYLLLNKTALANGFPLTSQFNYLTTKKRLIMITRTTSRKMVTLKQFAVLHFIALFVFLFMTRVAAQEKPAVAKKNNTYQVNKKGNKSYVSFKIPEKYQPPFNAKGVSTEKITEYKALENKVIAEKDYKNKAVYEAPMQAIFFQMSKDQQDSQIIRFCKSFPPDKKITITAAQLEEWKDEKMYGIWVDNKKIANANLDKYKPEDFALFSKGKLSKNAKNYGKHVYELNVMTNAAYKKYYAAAIKRDYNMYYSHPES